MTDLLIIRYEVRPDGFVYGRIPLRKGFFRFVRICEAEKLRRAFLDDIVEVPKELSRRMMILDVS